MQKIVETTSDIEETIDENLDPPTSDTNDTSLPGEEQLFEVVVVSNESEVNESIVEISILPDQNVRKISQDESEKRSRLAPGDKTENTFVSSKLNSHRSPKDFYNDTLFRLLPQGWGAQCEGTDLLFMKLQNEVSLITLRLGSDLIFSLKLCGDNLKKDHPLDTTLSGHRILTMEDLIRMLVIVDQSKISQGAREKFLAANNTPRRAASQEKAQMQKIVGATIDIECATEESSDLPTSDTNTTGLPPKEQLFQVVVVSNESEVPTTVEVSELPDENVSKMSQDETEKHSRLAPGDETEQTFVSSELNNTRRSPKDFYNESLFRILPRGWVAQCVETDLLFMNIQNEVSMITLRLDPELKFSLKLCGDSLKKDHPLQSTLSSHKISTVEDLISMLIIVSQWKTCQGVRDSKLVNVFLNATLVKDCRIKCHAMSLHS